MTTFQSPKTNENSPGYPSNRSTIFFTPREREMRLKMSLSMPYAMALLHCALTCATTAHAVTSAARTALLTHIRNIAPYATLFAQTSTIPYSSEFFGDAVICSCRESKYRLILSLPIPHEPRATRITRCYNVLTICLKHTRQIDPANCKYAKTQ